MKKKIKVLSLFDGISVAQQALKELGYTPEYYASEIDKYAMDITRKNHPNTVQLGSVTNIKSDSRSITNGTLTIFTGNIDLLIGGSPCQDLSIAKKNREGLSGSRSGLFWEYVRILKEVKPKYFVLENVNSMPKEAKAVITEALGVEPVMINASLVSAQNRKRLFWTNIPNVTLPEDRGILLKDILEEGTLEIEKAHCVDANYFKGGKIGGTHQSSKRNYTIRLGQIGKGGQGDRIYSPEGKSVGLSALGGGRGAKTGLYAVGVASRTYPRIPNGEPREKRIEARKDEKANSMTSVQGDSMVMQDTVIRKLTPIECTRLQSLPDDYLEVEGISNTQKYKCLGNAFNKEVVKHILSFMDNKK